MTYYKIISQSQVIGVGYMFARWSEKHNRFYYSQIDEANCVQDVFTQKFYRASWLKSLPETVKEAETATVIVINELEYNDLYETLKAEEVVPYTPPSLPQENQQVEIPENVQPPTEQPLTIQQMREKLKKQDETINMLVDCLLEVSEVVYNE